MDERDQSSLPSGGGFLRTAQIIASALVAGSLSFLLIAVFVRATGKNGLLAANPWKILPPEGPIALIALFVGASVLAASLMVPKAIVTAARQVKRKNLAASSEAGGFDGVFINEMIVGMALLECGAFFNGIAFMLEGRIPSLIAALVLILAMVARYPTRTTLDAFAENQEALLFEERQSA